MKKPILKKNLEILKLDLKAQCDLFNRLIMRGAILFDSEGNLMFSKVNGQTFSVAEVLNNIYKIKEEIKEMKNEGQ